MRRELLFFDFAFEEYLDIIADAATRGFRPIMNQPPMRAVLEERGVHTRPFAEFATQKDAEYAKERTRSLGRQLTSTLTSREAAGAFDSPSGNLLVAGGSDLVRKMLDMAQNQILIARIMERLIQSTDLGAVVMRSCLSSGQRTLQTVAASHGIPVLELSHGNPAWGADLAPPEYHWHFGVFGTREREALLDMGSQPELVHATGAAHWDHLYRNEFRPSKEQARASLGLPQDRPFIVLAGGLASGGTPFFARKAVQLMDASSIFLEGVSRLMPPPLVAVRPHPGESRQKPGRPPTPAEMADYRRWFADSGVELIHIDYSQRSLVNEKAVVFRAADVIVVPDASSTVVTEAMILERPVILIEPGETPFMRFYTEQDGIPTARTGNELGMLLDKILLDEPYRQGLLKQIEAALPELNQGHDGQSTARVVDLIEQITLG